MYHRLSYRPMLKKLQNAKAMAKALGKTSTKHWWIGGENSLAMAVHLLDTGNIIAIPTDTIYGLAGLARNPTACARLYEIKERSSSKPLAVCLNDMHQIDEWAVMDHVPLDLLKALLPGAITILLPRKPGVCQHLNPGTTNVGIRIPGSGFVCKVAEVAGPLVLTSANVSNQPSTVKPEEFADLWPRLGGIFHNQMKKSVHIYKSGRAGSTIVDLSVPDQYHVVRYGQNSVNIIRTLRSFNLQPRLKVMQEEQDNDTLKEKQKC